MRPTRANVEPLLLREVRDGLDRADAQRVRAAVQEIGVEQPAAPPPASPARSDPSGRCLHFDSGSSQHMPRVPLRTRRTSTPRRAASAAIACATCSAPSESAEPRRAGTYTRDRWPLRHQRRLPFGRRSSSKRSGRHAAVQLAVDHHRRRAGAVAEAVDRLERKRAVRGRLMKIDAERAAFACASRARWFIA